VRRHARCSSAGNDGNGGIAVNAILLYGGLLSAGYEVSSRLVGGTYQLRLTGPSGSMTMGEADDWETALRLAVEQAG
jgi:hypothetical protein